MLESINKFVSLYANVNNILIVGACLLIGLVLLDFILYLCSYSTLKKIITCLRDNQGEDIILAIERLKMRGRYYKMWEDYYDAYKNENTVTLYGYLEKEDLFVKRNIIKVIARASVLLCVVLMIVSSIKVTGMLKSEKYDIYAGAGILVGLQAICEIFYYVSETAKEKRLRSRLEEFRILSLRKLPGKAVDFNSMYLLSKMGENGENLSDIYGSVLTQNEKINGLIKTVDDVNGRLDRQYNELIKEDTEE